MKNIHWKDNKVLFCHGRAGPAGQMWKGFTGEILAQEEQLMMQDTSMEIHWRTAGWE